MCIFVLGSVRASIAQPAEQAGRKTRLASDRSAIDQKCSCTLRRVRGSSQRCPRRLDAIDARQASPAQGGPSVTLSTRT